MDNYDIAARLEREGNALLDTSAASLRRFRAWIIFSLTLLCFYVGVCAYCMMIGYGGAVHVYGPWLVCVVLSFIGIEIPKREVTKAHAALDELMADARKQYMSMLTGNRG